MGPSRLYDDASTERLVVASPAISGVPCTFDCWINLNDLSVFQSFVCVGTAGQDNHRFRIVFNDSTGFIGAGERSTNEQTAWTSTGPSVNTWHHICGRFVGDAERYSYIDGGSEGSNTGNRPASGMDETVIGAASSGAAGGYDYAASGLIAFPTIRNVDLSVSEIAALGRGAHPWSVRPSSIVYFSIDGLQNLVGTGLNMTASGTSLGSHGPPVSMWRPGLATVPLIEVAAAGGGGPAVGSLALMGIGK